jgi:hypothetical protein
MTALNGTRSSSARGSVGVRRSALQTAPPCTSTRRDGRAPRGRPGPPDKLVAGSRFDRGRWGVDTGGCQGGRGISGPAATAFPKHGSGERG